MSLATMLTTSSSAPMKIAVFQNSTRPKIAEPPGDPVQQPLPASAARGAYAGVLA
jgi:hypothetical protein